MSKFDELKKLAEAATQVKWELYHGNIAHDIDRDGAQIIAQRPARSGGSLQKTFDADFSFIAAANPAAILELLAIQAQLVAALKAAKTWHNGEKWRDSSDPSEVRAWEQHRDIISAAITAAEAKP